MYRELKIRAPFFEIGPKCLMWGEALLALAKEADKAAAEYDVDVILTPPACDIRLIAENTSHIKVFAQHMDALLPGRGMGRVLPEAIKEAGAVGVMLNHAEYKLTSETLNETIKRADAVGLATIVCADDAEEIEKTAKMSPNLIVAEPTALIGTGVTSGDGYVRATTALVASINPEILVLQGAGISSGKDVYDTIAAGAQGTGSTSGIFKSKDPHAMVWEMLSALRKAWDDTHK